MEREIHILIAEDDRGHFILAKRYFQEQGLKNRITWFANGQQILDFFFNSDDTVKDINPDQYVLLLDLRMPHVDGMDVLKKIRSAPSLAALPVIVLTALENPDITDKAYNLGADAFIVKPVKYSNYIEAMRKVSLFPSAIEGGMVLRPKKTSQPLQVVHDHCVAT